MTAAAAVMMVVETISKMMIPLSLMTKAAKKTALLLSKRKGMLAI